MRVKWKSAGLTWDLYCLFLKDLSGDFSCLIVRLSISQYLQVRLTETFLVLRFFCLLFGVFHSSLGICNYWRKDTGFAGCLIWFLTAISTSCPCKIKCVFGRAPVHCLCCPTAHGMHQRHSLCWSFVWMQTMPQYLCIPCATSANTWWLPPIKPCSEGFWLTANAANIFTGPNFSI